MKKIYSSSNFVNFANFANFATGYFARVAAVLLMLVTMSVGQVWGYDMNANCVYFDKVSVSSWTTPQIYIWKGDGSNNTYDLIEVKNGDNSTTGYFYHQYGYGGYAGFKFKKKDNWDGSSADFKEDCKSAVAYTWNGSDWVKTAVGVKNVSISNTTAGVTGSGTELDPYIVATGTPITVSASADKIVNDGHSRRYAFNGGSFSSTSTFTVVASAVAGQDYSVYADARAEKDNLSPSRAIRTATIYYRVSADPVTYTVAYATGNFGGTSVSCEKTSDHSNVTYNATVDSGTEVKFTAVASAGYEVEGWYNNADLADGHRLQAGGSTYTTTVTSNTAVWVKFIESATPAYPTLYVKAAWINGNWGTDATPMTHNGSGTYTRTLTLPAGNNKEFVIRDNTNNIEWKWDGYDDNTGNSGHIEAGVHSDPSSNPNLKQGGEYRGLHNFAFDLDAETEITFTVVYTDKTHVVVSIQRANPAPATEYYVYLGQTYALPIGTWQIKSSNQARYYDNLTEKTKQYDTGCSITNGNQFRAETLGEYTINDGANDATVYVYRYYAKYPWGACSAEPAEDYNRARKWQAMDVENNTQMSVVGLYSHATGNHANIGWDYHYDWDGIYRSDGGSNPNVHPGVMDGSNGIWTDGSTDAKDYGGAEYKEMTNPVDLDCNNYVKLTYTSTVPASGTTAPTVGGTFTPEKYTETTEWQTLTYAAVPAAGGLVTHDASGDKVKSGTKVTFTATPKGGYTFVGWYSDEACTTQITGEGVGDNRYQLTVTKNVSVYAKFDRNTGWYLCGDAFGGWDDNKVFPTTHGLNQSYRGMDGIFYREVTLTQDKYFKVSHDNKPYAVAGTQTIISVPSSVYNISVEWDHSFTTSSTRENVWVVVNTGSTKQLWVEAPKTFHTVIVTETTNAEYGEFTLTTTPDGVPASMATTQYADGEEYLLSITVPNALVTPSITVDGALQSLTKENDTHYTYTGTMGASDVAIEISYAVEYDFTFKLLIGVEEKYTGRLGQSVTFDTSNPVNFPCNPVGYSYWIRKDEGANWEEITGAATHVINELGTVLFKAIGMCSGTPYKEKVCTLTVEIPVLEQIEVTPATIYPNTVPITITPTVSGFEGSPSNLFVCYEYTTTPAEASTSFAANGTRGACTTKVDKVGKYTVSAQLKYGTNCANADNVGEPKTADFIVLDDYVTLTVPATASVGNVNMSATSNLVDATYTFYVTVPGSSTPVQFATGASANANYNCSMVGSYTFKVVATKDGVIREDTKICEVSAATLYLRYSFWDDIHSTRGRNNVPMTYNATDGTYYYYQTTATKDGWYRPVSSYDASWSNGGGKYGAVTTNGSADDDAIGAGNWLTIQNPENLDNSTNPVIFHYDQTQHKLWITRATTSYRVKSAGVNGTFYSNVIKKEGEEISFYASTDATLTWQSSANGLDGWTDGATFNGGTKVSSNGIYVCTPTAIDASAQNVSAYTGVINVYSVAFGTNALTKFTTTTYYDHYFVEWADAGKNVGATMGNSINTNISTVLSQYNVPTGANVRYEYMAETNRFTRTLIGGSSSPEFINIYGDNIRKTDDAVIDSEANSLKLSDGSNWVYTADIKAVMSGSGSGAKVTLVSTYNLQKSWILAADGSQATAEAKKVIVVDKTTTSGTYDLHLIYDYKTNKITAGWLGGNVTGDNIIDADFLVIRKDIDTEDDGPTIINLKAAGSVVSLNNVVTLFEMRRDHFYNDSKDWLSDNNHYYWFSLPYDCKISDIYGWEGYGTKWWIEEYRGDARAAISWYDFIPTWWSMMYTTGTMRANVGYVIYVNPAYDDFKTIEDKALLTLYFPSSTAEYTIAPTGGKNVVVPAHTCSVTSPQDRRNLDSDWNVIGVPGYMDAKLNSAFDYCYKWNSVNDYTVMGVTAATIFKPTFAYMVQYHGTLVWNTGADLSWSAPSRQSASVMSKRLCLQLVDGDGEMRDQTYVTLTPEGSEAYDMGDDLLKIFSASASHIYTTANNICLAANDLCDTTTVVPVGTQLKDNDMYAFHMSQSIDGVTPYLYDAELGIYTNLLVDDYYFTAETARRTGRFFLIFGYQAPSTPTGVNTGAVDSDGGGGPQKFIRNGMLFILNNGKLYNANGSAL